MSEMLETIVGATNIMKAYENVVANHGSGGVDGVTTEELLGYLRENYPRMRREILTRTYRPQPVLRVEILFRKEAGAEVLRQRSCRDLRGLL